MDRRAPTAAATAPPLATPERGLGDRVRRLRNARGLTQTELAEARVSKEYISQIETGKTRPTPQTLEWLAKRLGVDRTTWRTASRTPTIASTKASSPRRRTRCSRSGIARPPT